MNTIVDKINLLLELIEDRDIAIEHSLEGKVLSILHEIKNESTKNDINTSTPESMEQSINDLMTINIKYDTDKGITGILETASILKDSLIKAAYKMSNPNDEIKSSSDAEIYMLHAFGKWEKI